ncbi:deoxyribodipyrimidine photo-lyase, partial [Jimgerdemannia flammicorona]
RHDIFGWTFISTKQHHLISTFYSLPSVFTPFKASWLNHLETQKSPTTPGSLALLDQAPTPTSNPSTARNAHASLFTDPAFAIPASLPSLPLPAHQKNLIQTLYPPGEPAAHARLTAFLTTKIASYHLARDQPAKDGCSALSPYLAAGVISARQCLRAARRANGGKLRTGKEGVVGWVSELAWRDFYRHVLFHFPRVCMGRAFKQETEKVEWAEDLRGVKFKAWCEGKTGFPIVDAGMRQMKEIGWMHNRVRMCAAMFLSKDLLLDWRMGEKFFMQHLIDGDFASNNGGWQWAASTGTDAQPYFRVFNPHLQSERFDSEGEYVRRWIPELKEVRVPAVHDPSGALVKEEFEKLGYAYPIVDHKQARERALAAYKKALAK